VIAKQFLLKGIHYYWLSESFFYFNSRRNTNAPRVPLLLAACNESGLRERVGIDQWMKISVKSILFFLCIERKKKIKKKKERRKRKEKKKRKRIFGKKLKILF
jgi:hypothetical protein